MKAAIFFTCALALVALASATSVCPEDNLEQCETLRCSHVATKVYYRDSNGCWTCFCENETPAPTDSVTTNQPTTVTLPPTPQVKKITHLRDMCVSPENPSSVIGANRFKFRPLVEGEVIADKYLAWLRPRQCGVDGLEQCWRVRDCDRNQLAECQVMEVCLANEVGCVGFSPRYCESIPTDMDCNEDGTPDIEQDNAEVIFDESINGTICAWSTDPELTSDFFIKKVKTVEVTPTNFVAPFGGIRLVTRDAGMTPISYNFKLNPYDASPCSDDSEIVIDTPAGEVALNDDIAQFKDDACRFKIKVADNDDVDSNSNDDIVKLEFFVGTPVSPSD